MIKEHRGVPGGKAVAHTGHCRYDQGAQSTRRGRCRNRAMRQGQGQGEELRSQTSSSFSDGLEKGERVPTVLYK